MLCLFCKVNLASILNGKDGAHENKNSRAAQGAEALAELADAVGTTRQTITSIEVGKYTASLPLAYKIARFFGLTIEEVFDFSDLDA